MLAMRSLRSAPPRAERDIDTLFTALERTVERAIAASHSEAEAAASLELTRLLLARPLRADAADAADARAFAAHRVERPCTVVLAHYCALCEAPPTGASMRAVEVLAAAEGALVTMLRALLALPSAELRTHLRWLFPHCVQILKAGVDATDDAVAEEIETTLGALLMRAYDIFVQPASP
jgi:hypothetical protein